MKFIKTICFSLFLLISLSYIFIIISPRIFKGFYPFGIKTAIVETGSMEPTLKINDFVIVKKPKKVEVDDIVSYTNNGKSEVLHRVVRINKKEIITKGDANNTEDQPINISQVTGIYVGKIKYLGNIISIMKKPLVFSTIITVLLILWLITRNKKTSN